MRILVAHNSHKIAGGEQQVFESETALLESAGHEVVRFNIHNDQIDSMSRLSLGAKTIWNRESQNKLLALIDQHAPEIIHAHNILPLISPSLFGAAKKRGVKTVWTLHNYRLICPGMFLMRDEKVCEKCVGRKVALPAIRHKCYRGSTVATSAVTMMQAFHTLIGTWKKCVDQFIAPSEFARSKLIEGGLPADRIITKANFVPGDPKPGSGESGALVYVGRLSEEKGIEVLLDAWASQNDLPPLKIVGDGPMRDRVTEVAHQNPSVEYLGLTSHAEALQIMSESVATIVPSTCYETFGLVAAESFSVGTPVIASRIGALQELIEEGKNGMLFHPGHSYDLAKRIGEFYQLNPVTMRQPSRACYEKRYTSRINLAALESIYQGVLARKTTQPANVEIPLWRQNDDRVPVRKESSRPTDLTSL